MIEPLTDDVATTSVIEGDRVLRFSLRMLVQHIILIILLITLAVTGLTLS